jgi:hypothetical protein
MLPLRDSLYLCEAAIHEQFRYRDVALLLLAMLSHASPIRLDLDVGPGMLRVLLGREIALVQSLRPRGAHVILAALREARRREGGKGKSESNSGYSFVSNNHDRISSIHKLANSSASLNSSTSLMCGAACAFRQAEKRRNAALPPLHHLTERTTT